MGCCLSNSNADLIEKLTESPFFCLEDIHTNLSDLAILSQRFTKARYSANQILWKRGDTNTTFNVILRGEVYGIMYITIKPFYKTQNRK